MSGKAIESSILSIIKSLFQATIRPKIHFFSIRDHGISSRHEVRAYHHDDATISPQLLDDREWHRYVTRPIHDRSIVNSLVDLLTIFFNRLKTVYLSKKFVLFTRYCVFYIRKLLLLIYFQSIYIYV